MEYTVNKEYGISVATLYKALGKNLSYTTIDYTNDDGDEYYDLCNANYQTSIMDGETCFIVGIGSNTLIMSRQADKFDNMFVLTIQEADICLFPIATDKENDGDKCRYAWDGMKALTIKQAEALLDKNALDGCFKLYADGTESVIEAGYSKEEIIRFLDAGGTIGVEYITRMLPDGRKVQIPERTVITDITFFDEMEDDLWVIVKGYFALFGIKLTEEDDCPGFCIVKEMQDTLIRILEECGMKIF